MSDPNPEHHDEAALSELTMQLEKLSTNKTEQLRLLKLLTERLEARHVTPITQPADQDRGGQVESVAEVELTEKKHEVFQLEPYLAEINPEAVDFINGKIDEHGFGQVVDTLKNTPKVLTDEFSGDPGELSSISNAIKEFDQNAEEYKKITGFVREYFGVPLSGEPADLQRKLDNFGSDRSEWCKKNNISGSLAVPISFRMERAVKAYTKNYKEGKKTRPKADENKTLDKNIGKRTETIGVTPPMAKKEIDKSEVPKKVDIRDILASNDDILREALAKDSFSFKSKDELAAMKDAMNLLWDKISAYEDAHHGENLDLTQVMEARKSFIRKLNRAEEQFEADSLRARLMKDFKPSAEIEPPQEVKSLMNQINSYLHDPKHNTIEQRAQFLEKLQQINKNIVPLKAQVFNKSISDVGLHDFSKEDEKSSQINYLGYEDASGNLFVLPCNISGGEMNRLADMAQPIGEAWSSEHLQARVESITKPIVLKLRNSLGNNRNRYEIIQKGEVKLIK